MTEPTRNPKTHEEMLVFLNHEAKKDPEIAATIYKVKDGHSWKANYQNLNEASRDNLAKTYAHLMGFERVEVEEVAVLNKDGLRVMILHRLLQLMPTNCQTCHNTYFYGTTDRPMVCCKRCDKGACGDCYPSNPGAGKSFFYICTDCEKIVTTSIGFEGLDQKTHLLKRPKLPKKKVVEAVEDRPKEAEPNEADESCMFLQDVEDDSEKDKSAEPEDKEEEVLFMEQPKRGYKR